MSHAILSPSKAERWLACTPSARLELLFPDTAGTAAQEGSLAHKLAEIQLKLHFKQITKQSFNKHLRNIKQNSFYNADMEQNTDNYKQLITNRYNKASKPNAPAILKIEQSIDLRNYVPDSFGTCDALILGRGSCEVIDLKYGKGVQVNSFKNKQMMLYALGAIDSFRAIYKINKIKMTIYQPRLNNISTYELPSKELLKWAAEELKPRALLAFKGEGEFKTGEHCRFCKAQARCKKYSSEQLKVAKQDFIVKAPALLNDEAINTILQHSEQIKTWLKNVEDFALNEAIAGRKQWRGFKLVQGAARRIYADEKKAAQVLLQNGFKPSKIFSKSLLGITAMQKSITKKKFDELLTPLLTRPTSKPRLIPAQEPEDDFNN